MADGGVRRGKRKAGLPGLCWKTCYFHLLFWVVCVSGDDKTLIVETWLKNYGYLLPLDIRTSDLRQEKAMQSAVAAMQRFYGIPVTGQLDHTTLEWMRRPRCGVPDHPRTSRRQRNKRYALTGQKWRDKKISYSISNFTPKVGEKDTQRA
ncbi:matrix metalloproteinase-24, partial [Gadus morhua]|uniref:matrix metalloproteinase-24 n=2 Tax=Gadus TaxID=8048 RepID=UPI0011B6F574